ncbi:PAS domain S-box protein [Halorhabdus rudnickae]|uniref:PAS domain S-box protein n=1 Tax=Halorhabdus rudnickae TaxID=1775544 RepID=UPI0010823EF2|nr:PAS domain S-box protein [Halorhabdus rudnickae]
MRDTTLDGHAVRQRLHEIVRKNISFDEKAQEALELGKQYLGVDNAYVTRIDQETDHWEILITTDTADGQLQSGIEREIEETYCRETINDDIPVALHDAPNQGWGDDPAFEISGNHTYLGVPLVTENEPYGTVCFAAQDPRSESFSEAEVQFADHLTRLLERELEKELIEGELTNQTNLATVLHRVLRHNLRNDISVIRGHAELMADQLDDDSVGEIVLSHIDDLIQLSEKARELEDVVTTSSERRTTEFGSLIEDVVSTISQKFPSASIAVEYDNEVHGRVLQNFDRAIEELIENAVKHSGDNPTVTVTIESVPNAIEIEISDTGPGLPENEAEVLTSGEETPLAHGSGLGLWLAYWIVTSHDGSIEPEVTQHGTTMRVTIPRKPIVGVQQQLTELTRSRDKYKTSFEEATDAISIINDDGRILDANEAASTMFGVEHKELLGRSLREFFPDEFPFETEWQVFQESGTRRDTATILGADGQERTIEYSGTTDIIPNQHLFIGRDITKRQERERELEVAETVFQTTQDALFLADVVDNQEYRLNRVNEAFEHLTQRNSANIIGLNPRELLGPEAGANVQSQFGKCVQNQKSVEFEQLVPVDSGSRIWQVRVTPLMQDGEVTQLVGAMRNITERKAREQELQALTERYQTLLEAAPDPVFVADAETKEIIEVNSAAEQLLGMSSDEILGMHQSELHPAEQTDLYQQFFDEHLESGGSKRRLPDGSHTAIVTADGDRIPIEISASTVSLSDRSVIYGIFRDISEQIEREQALEATTHRHQLALEGTDTGVWDWSIGTDEVHWSESLERLVGIEPGAFEGTFDAFAAYIHPDDRQEAIDAVELAAETDSPFQTEYRVQRQDGTYIWVESRGEIYDDRNNTQRMVGIVTDITEHKEREAELTRKTEAMEKAPVAITLSDPDQPDNPLVYANERFSELTGCAESEVLGQNCRFLQGPETNPEQVAEIRDAIENEEPVSTVLRNYRKDGTMFWNRLTIAPIRDDDGEIKNWVGFQEDITERIDREQQQELAEVVFENTQDALFVIDVTEDHEFYIERVNEVYEEFTGLSNAEIVGKTPVDAVGEEIGSEIESQYRECMERQETLKYPEEIPVDGEIRQWETKLTPVLSEGTVDKLVGAMRDVTSG